MNAAARSLSAPLPLVVRRQLKRLLDPAARATRARDAELGRLADVPRDTPGSTTLLGRRFHYLDARAFCDLYQAIFIREIYRFETARSDPLVLDCGANIGLATLYVKQLLPQARVVAFEPDPIAADTFERNVVPASLPGVELRREAVWTRQGTVEFGSGPIDRGRVAGAIVAGDGGGPDSVTEVAAVRLRDFLVEPIALLKIDIEGAEVDVLGDCADRLDVVDLLFVEYHGFAGAPQRLVEMFEVLQSAGFRCYVEHEGRVVPHPLVDRRPAEGMDLQLNISCVRQG